MYYPKLAQTCDLMLVGKLLAHTRGHVVNRLGQHRLARAERHCTHCRRRIATGTVRFQQHISAIAGEKPPSLKAKRTERITYFSQGLPHVGEAPYSAVDAAIVVVWQRKPAAR